MKQKIYGLYNIKDNEQCEYFGTIHEIAKYLNANPSSLYKYICLKKQGKIKYVKHKYDLIEMEDK